MPKVYYTGSSCWGLVGGVYLPFATEEEYYEYLKENLNNENA